MSGAVFQRGLMCEMFASTRGERRDGGKTQLCVGQSFLLLLLLLLVNGAWERGVTTTVITTPHSHNPDPEHSM